MGDKSITYNKKSTNHLWVFPKNRVKNPKMEDL